MMQISDHVECATNIVSGNNMLPTQEPMAQLLNEDQTLDQNIR